MGKNLNRHHAPPLRSTGKRVIRRHRAARTLANVTTLRHNARPSANTNLHGPQRHGSVRSIDRSIDRSDNIHVSSSFLLLGKEQFATVTEARPRRPPMEISVLSFSRVTTARMYGTYDYRSPVRSPPLSATHLRVSPNVSFSPVHVGDVR